MSQLHFDTAKTQWEICLHLLIIFVIAMNDIKLLQLVQVIGNLKVINPTIWRDNANYKRTKPGMFSNNWIR